MDKPSIVITLGDPTGIGPEIVKKAILSKAVRKICKPIIIGTSRGFTPGFPSDKSNKAAISFLVKALELAKNKEVDAIVTSPVPKSAFVYSNRLTCPPYFLAKTGKVTKQSEMVRACSTESFRQRKLGGHTEFLAEKTSFQVDSSHAKKNVEMLMVAKDKKVLLLTRHVPLKDVSQNISIKKIVGSTTLAYEFIKKYFKIKKPKIIICGLNPHCGDNGLVGIEEKEKIIPAIEILKKSGIDVFGPVNCEIAFKKKSDLIVCMYHDQAMSLLKLLNPNKIVNVTIGLPFIRTSPAHGTAYDIAGKNKANPQSMIEAIKLACQLAPLKIPSNSKIPARLTKSEKQVK
ncbi:MAG: 4-hydroxythreonine-4-phosphate dehydrogenase PdxA [Elusimicrobiota bacterium]